MAVNRKSCSASHDFRKKARTGKHKRLGDKPRRTPEGMTTTAWKRAGRPKASAQ